MSDEVYLGDGVYMSSEAEYLKLWNQDGVPVYLDAEVLDAFGREVKRRFPGAAQVLKVALENG